MPQREYVSGGGKLGLAGGRLGFMFTGGRSYCSWYLRWAPEWLLQVENWLGVSEGGKSVICSGGNRRVVTW